MTPRAQAWLLALATVAAGSFVCGVIFFTLCSCASELPEETGWVETVSLKDASMHSYNAP